jgi:opacity protein-like surface antigen
MRKVLLAVSVVVGLSLAAHAAAAQTKQWQFGPEVGFATNSLGPFVGGRVVYSGLGSAIKVPGLEAYGSFDYFFPSTSGWASSVTIWEINANATWDIPNMTGGFKPYVGGGLNYVHYSFSACTFCAGSSTGLNLLGGTHFKPTPKVNMFGEIKIELHSGSAVAFTVGVLF